MSFSIGSLRQAAAKTRSAFRDRLASVFSKSELSAEVWDDLEEMLITADVGVSTTENILGELRGRERKGQIREIDGLREGLHQELVARLNQGISALALDDQPVVILVVGFNGAGKTTTVAKLGRYWQQAGKRVLLVAGDTFRAAGGEQLNIWAERLGLQCIAGQRGADAAALLFDAIASARARGFDVVLVDTAGRIHTKTNLMDELGKMRGIAQRQQIEVRTLLVLDASTGQNGIAQARAFRDAVGLDGIVVTKLDGTAKGGVLFAVADELGAPVRFVGTGEQPDDLVVFDPEAFVTAVLE